MAGLMALVASLFFSMAIAFGLMYYKQNPEAQLRKRLHEMIDQAEAERAKRPKQKKNITPTIVKLLPSAATQFANRTESKLARFFRRRVRPFLSSLEERFQRFTPNEIRLQLEDKIFHAGKMGVWSVKRLITVWCLAIVASTALAIIMIHSMELHPLQKIFLILLGAFVGAAVPFAILNSAIRNRQKAIRKQLPEFLDILCVSVQAGLSFDGAVGKMTKRMHGPLIDEFKRMQNDVALGMTHQYALTNLAKRCDLEEVYLFTTSIIQAEKLGTSMTRTLKVQADNMRDRHRQHIKALALKAPVKIIFPMVLFIFPSIFVVLLYPAMISLIRAFGK